MATPTRENSYRSILKGTSLFGGIQAVHLLLSLVRGKCVALFLGPAGMGMAALFTSTADTVQRICSLGLNLAIVKEAASVRDNQEELRRVNALISRMVLLTAALGALVCLCAASLLSDIAFGNEAQRWQMAALGIVVALTLMWQGKMSVLQGMHRVRDLSIATLVGSVTALCAMVPLYWLFGTDGIVPAMMAYAAVMLLFYSRKVRKALGASATRLFWRQQLPLARRLVLAGVVLMSNDLFNTASQYMLQAFIRWHGTLDDVGLLQGANSLTVQYSGLIFSAMAMDYFPRLTAAIGHHRDFATIVNRQTEIITLVMAPLGALLILFAPLVVKILLVDSFAPAVPLIRIMTLTIVLRGACYPMGYVTFAMDNRKVYFWLEGVGCTFMSLALRCAGYLFGSLAGLCWAMVADMTLTWGIYLIVNYRLYRYTISHSALRCTLFSTGVTALCLVVALLWESAGSYIVQGLLAAAAAAVAWIGLRRRMATAREEEMPEE